MHDEYAKLPGINASAIKRGAISMAHMRQYITEKQDGETPKMRWGRLVHASVLEPDAFANVVSIWRGRPLKSGKNKGELSMERKGEEWDAFVSDCGGKDWIVDPSEFAKLMTISNAVHAQPVAHELIKRTQHEHPLVWNTQLYGDAKALCDGMADGLIVELKTTARITPRGFAAQVFGMSYHLQFGWYVEGYSNTVGGLPEYRCIAIESEPPYCLTVYTMRPSDLLKWRAEAVAIVEQYRACEREGRFPGPADGVVEFQPPEWADDGDTVNMEGVSDE